MESGWLLLVNDSRVGNVAGVLPKLTVPAGHSLTRIVTRSDLELCLRNLFTLHNGSDGIMIYSWFDLTFWVLIQIIMRWLHIFWTVHWLLGVVALGVTSGTLHACDQWALTRQIIAMTINLTCCVPMASKCLMVGSIWTMHFECGLQFKNDGWKFKFHILRIKRINFKSN